MADGTSNNDFRVVVGLKLDDDVAISLNKQIGKLSINPVPINVTLNTRDIQEQINTLRNQIQSLNNIQVNIGGNNNGNGGRNAQRGINDVTRAYQNLLNIQSRINSKELALDKLDTTKNQREIIELTTQINNLYQKYQSLYNLFNGQFSNVQIDRLNRNFDVSREKIELLNKKLADTKENFAVSFDLDKQNALLGIDTWLKDNSAAAKRFGEQIDNLRAKINACDNKTDLNNLKKEFKALQKEVKTLGLNTQTYFDKFKAQMSKLGVYYSASAIFMHATQGLREMYDNVVLIDTAMTELIKVTNETDKAYSNFLDNVGDKAQKIGTTVDGLISSTADFARLGYSLKDAQELAEVANIYAVVGDEIDSVDQATESLISTLTAFGDEVDAMGIVDKFNEIGNNFAISSGGIGEALKRSASSLAAANNTLDESIALITAANTVVQDPESVGTAFKTISMRIRGARTELEAAGLETEGMAESTAKMRDEIMALTGVDIMLDENTFKGTYEILDEIAEKWGDLSDIQQASVTELIAGKRQGNIVSALMENFDIAESALEKSLKSEGSALEEHAKWMESLQAHLNELKDAFQDLSKTVLNSDLLKVGISFITGLINLLNALIKTLGGIGSLSAIFTIFTIFKGESLISGVAGLAKEFFNLDKFAKLSSMSLSDVFKRLKDIAKSPKGIATAIGLVTTAISMLVSAYKNWEAEQSHRRQEILKSNNEILDSIDSVEQAYVKYSGKTDLTSKEESELKSAIDGTIEAFGDKAGVIQNVIDKNTDYIKSLQDVTKAEIQEAKRLADENLHASKKELEKLSSGLIGSKINVNLGGIYETGDNKEIRKILQQTIPEYVNDEENGYGLVLNYKLAPTNLDDMDSVVSYYYALVKAKDKLNDLGYVESDIYQNIKNTIDDLSGAVNEYTTQQYNSLKYQYELEHGIPKTIEEYESLKKYILENVDASQEYLDILSDIANKDFSNILGIDLGKHYAKLEKLNGLKQKYLSSKDFKNSSWFNSQEKLKGFEEWLNGLSEKQIDILCNIKVDDSELQNWNLLDWQNYLADNEKVNLSKYSFADLVKDESFSNTVDNHIEKVNALKDALEKVKDGSFSDSDFIELTREFPELADDADNLEEALKKSIEDINLGTFEQLISYLEYMDSDADYSSLQNFIVALTDAEVEMKNVLDFSGFIDNLNNVVDSFDGLVSAMSKLRDGTALTKGELVDLISEYPQLLTEANLFTDGSIAGQNKMLDNLLKVYEAEYNATIDTKIAELKAANEILRLAEDNEKAKAKKLIEIAGYEVDGKVEEEADFVKALQDFNDLEGQNYVDYSNGVLNVNKESLEGMLTQEGDKVDLAEKIWDNQAVDIAESYADGSSDALKSINTFGSRLKTWASNIITKIFKPTEEAYDAAFDPNKTVEDGISDTSIDTEIKAGLYIDEDSKEVTINGQSVEDWTSEQRNITEQRIKNIQEELNKNNNAIKNLEALKGLDLVSTYGGDGSGSGSSSKSSKTFNWIEVAIERVQRALSKLDKTASNTYKSWSSRNDALRKQIKETNKEIDLQNKAIEYYKQKANSIDLDDKLKEKVRTGLTEGSLEEVIKEIDTSTDEGKALEEKISQYQEWYGKILECEDAIEDLKQSESELYKQAFDNVMSQYESRLSIIEHEKSMIDSYISQSEAKGWVVSTKYYDTLKQHEENNIASLQAEKDALINALEDGVANGGIEKFSEEWFNMCNEIDSVTLAIEEGKLALLEYDNAIREIEWSIFDMLQDQISQVTDEANFLIDLMSNDKLYDDKGQLTDSGMATMGMHGMNYNTYMHQADLYAEKILEIEKELAEDPYDTALIERKQELIGLQQDSILAAEDSKNAIVDMVKNGIELELDALNELINANKEALDSQKD